MLGEGTVAGRSFLDLGCGSGLFSLAAVRLGARRVHSLDLDPECLACAHTLRERLAPPTADWTVAAGDALERESLARLGSWDIVYSWGVLHHTGQMWQALANAADRVGGDGLLFVSLYNDQGLRSHAWRQVKRFYNQGRWQARLVCALFFPYFWLGGAVMDVLRARPPWRRYLDYYRQRGMSAHHDILDWLGGFPFEVARPEEVEAFLGARNFTPVRVRTCAGKMGCNEFVFRRRK